MHVYYVKPVNKTQGRKAYICAPEDVLLLIINNIHNLTFFIFRLNHVSVRLMWSSCYTVWSC